MIIIQITIFSAFASVLHAFYMTLKSENVKGIIESLFTSQVRKFNELLKKKNKFY